MSLEEPREIDDREKMLFGNSSFSAYEDDIGVYLEDESFRLYVLERTEEGYKPHKEALRLAKLWAEKYGEIEFEGEPENINLSWEIPNLNYFDKQDAEKDLIDRDILKVGEDYNKLIDLGTDSYEFAEGSEDLITCSVFFSYTGKKDYGIEDILTDNIARDLENYSAPVENPEIDISLSEEEEETLGYLLDYLEDETKGNSFKARVIKGKVPLSAKQIGKLMEKLEEQSEIDLALASTNATEWKIDPKLIEEALED